jgi:hypothetical protein
MGTLGAGACDSLTNVESAYSVSELNNRPGG